MPLPLPAICDNCGAVFSSGIAVSGTLISCKAGPCPVCDGMGSIPDGTYQTVGNVIRLLAGPQKTIEQLRNIAAIIEQARKLAKQPEKATETIKKQVPELATIADALPRTRNELYGFLTVILMAIGTIIAAAALYTDKGPTEQEVKGMIDKSIERAFEENRKIDKSSPQRSVPKPGKNDPCPCGSGKKYKHCCLQLI